MWLKYLQKKREYIWQKRDAVLHLSHVFNICKNKFDWQGIKLLYCVIFHMHLNTHFINYKKNAIKNVWNKK